MELKQKINCYENWINNIEGVLKNTNNTIRCIELRAQLTILKTIVSELKEVEELQK